MAVVAVAVHHFYGAVESAFERIARRPHVLRVETARALAPVLGFRHFFRHAYAVPFEPARLQLVAQDVLAAHAKLTVDLDAFEQVLRDALKG